MEGITFFFPWEVSFMVFIQHHMSSAAVQIANLFSLFGEEGVLILVLGFLYWCYDRKMARHIGIHLILGQLFNPMLKNLVLRRRPYFDHPEIQCLRPVDPSADLYSVAAQSYSFPSGHSLNSLMVFGSIALYKKTIRLLWILAVIIPFLTGFSRIMTGNHYPTDVLCGWIQGAMVIWLSVFLQKKIQNKKILYSIMFLIAVPGFFFCKTTDFYSCTGLMLGFFAADLFWDKRGDFEMTRKPLCCVLRIAGGILIYLILNTILKLPFSAEFLAAPVMTSFLVRICRYAIIIFVMLGIYPACFKWKWLS